MIMSVAACVPDPLVIVVDVGRFGMTFLVAIVGSSLFAWSFPLRHVLVLLGLLSRRVLVLLRRVLSLNAEIPWRPVAGNVSAAHGSIGSSAARSGLRVGSRGRVIFVLCCKGKRKDK